MEPKNQKLPLIASSVVLLVLVVIAFWQTSLNELQLQPRGPAQTVILWAISILVGLGVFTLGFIVFRSLLKLYIERRKGRLGSKIKTKMLAGAFALSILPVVCLIVFSFFFLNRTMDKWFNRPTEEILQHSEVVTDDVLKRKAETDARWVASLPEVVSALRTGTARQQLGSRLREVLGAEANYHVALLPVRDREVAGFPPPIAEFEIGEVGDYSPQWPVSASNAEQVPEPAADSVIGDELVQAYAKVTANGQEWGRVVVAWRIPDDLLARRAAMQRQQERYSLLRSEQQYYRYFYPGLLALIAIFVLFVATWLALFLSKQIIVPIEALVQATEELSSGHLEHRVQTPAIDELAALVRSFNEMTRQLETKTGQLQKSNAELAQANVELEARRRLIDAILESIAPGVVSISAQGEILRANSSFKQIFSVEEEDMPARLPELFPPEDRSNLDHMMNRARRTGQATRELEIKQNGKILHLAVTVSALPREDAHSGPRGYVVVLEDMTELLGAQKSAAWHEVARRVAHEIKNPLTPIALSAERMDRLLKRYSEVDDTPERRSLRERFQRCTDIIVQEVETLRRLVDEFSQLARFPAAQRERADLNQIVESALTVFEGRLDGVRIHKQLMTGPAPIFVDPAQFKRVLINLIDNAAEALTHSWVKEIFIATAPGTLPDTVEVTVADSGHGISAEDKERLFLPYFSTRKRGTGLGLAIVSRILTEHGANIRVEDNRPTGSRFIIEVPVVESSTVVETRVSA